jgi:hypothetical protein
MIVLDNPEIRDVAAGTRDFATFPRIAAACGEPWGVRSTEGQQVRGARRLSKMAGSRRQRAVYPVRCGAQHQAQMRSIQAQDGQVTIGAPAGPIAEFRAGRGILPQTVKL